MANDAASSTFLILSEVQDSTLTFASADIKGMALNSDGSLALTLANGSTATIENFRALAMNNVKLTLADGSVLEAKALFDKLADEMPPVEVIRPDAGGIVEYDLQSGQKFRIAFDMQGGDVQEQDGNLIITFDDGGQIVLLNFAAAMDSESQPDIFFGGNETVSLEEFFASLRLADAMEEGLPQSTIREAAGEAASEIEPAAGEDAAPESESDINEARTDMDALAEELAGVEPAAGEGGAAGGRGGFGFQSAVDAAPLGAIPPIGPIGPTALAFGLPEPNNPSGLPETEDPRLAPPSVLANLGVNDAIVKEDGSIFVPISASLASSNPAGTVLTVTVTGIDSSWTITNLDGIYNAATGTWTITLPAGTTSYNGGLTFAPPADSDADMGALTASATATFGGLSASATDPFNVLTDAVADVPTVNANSTSGLEDNPVPVDISGAVTDLDGSETVTHFQIFGVPAGFSFNQGTDLGGGVWQFTPAQTVGLEMNAPANFFGSVSLGVTVFNEETNLSDTEVDFTDNTNQATTDFSVTWKPVIDPPSVLANNGVDDAQVKEDGSVVVPLVASLNSVDSPDAFLTVTVTGFDPAWGSVTASTGSFNAAGTEWTVTLPPGTNLSMFFTFTPTAQSDIDLTGLVATATATEPITGTTATAADGFNVVTDAVADDPSITASGGTANEGTPIAVSVAASLGADLDGSETITGYQISGVPSGFTFNNGTDLGGGVWSFTDADLAGLTITSTDPDFDGTLGLVATVFTTENPVSDGEFDPTDNDNRADTQFTVTWRPTIDPPTISVNGGVDDAQVKEDGSVTVNITASLSAGAEPAEFLTVTVTGFDPAWGAVTAPIGTFIGNTWVVTLAAGQNLNTNFTFTPDAQSDIDLTGLVAVATAIDPVEGIQASSAPDTFNVIVDAVADDPSIAASGGTAQEGTPIAVTISGSLGADTDGSEVISGYQVSGVPAGFTFNNGVNLGGGVWAFTAAQLAGLTITAPNADFDGQLSLTATVLTTENPVSDGEFDASDNNNSASQNFIVKWTPDIDPPAIKVNNGADDVRVKEDGSVDVSVVATLAPAHGANEFLTVTITGFDPAWGAVTAPVGNFINGGTAWTITLAPGVNLSTVFTFTPDAQSDIDLTGLVATATASDPSEGLSASSSDSFNVIVDAVADAPAINATGGTAQEGTPIAITINGALGADNFDGSETITGYRISGVPAGFTLNHGTNAGGGVWTLTAADLVGLTITAPGPDFDGQLTLFATVLNTENPVSDGEFDGSDNDNSASAPFTVTWTPDIDPPTISVNGGIDNAQVKEDGSVVVNVTASLAAGHGANEFLTVTITGFDPAWGTVTATAGGFSLDGTTWTAVLPAGANLNTNFTFTPNAQSDIDLTGLVAVATATDPSEGLSASSGPDTFNVIVDAVADTPSINATGGTAQEGTPIAISVSGSLGADTDGSEVITGYRISGVPAGFTLNHGMDAGGGVWTLTAADLAGLTITAPSADFDGQLTLTATVLTTENPVSDGEFDASDNNNSASRDFTVKWTPDLDPPSISVNGGVDSVQVKEDGSVNVAVTASLAVGHGPAEFLTVTITGFDPAWGTVTAPAGSFINGGTEWTITLAPGASLNTVFTFTPDAQSDIDLTGLVAVATATDPVEGLSASSGPDSFSVIVDAVADAPSINATGGTEEEGHPIAINVAGFLGVDNFDGSEVISGYQISGVPAGFTLNHGTDAGGGVWNLTAADLAGLTISSANPAFEGQLSLTATVFTTENPVSDGEFDTTDNNAQASKTFKVTWTDDDEPLVAPPAPLTVDETALVNGNIVVSDTISVNFGDDTPGTFTANGSFASGGSKLGGNLTSDGFPVSVALVGNTYVGTANGQTVFTLAIAGATYTFTQFGNLDHADASNPNDVINMTFGVTVADSDNDSVDTTITVNVLDDAPHIDDVDDLVIPNVGGQYTGEADVSGIQDDIDHFVLSALNGQVPDGVTYTVYGPGAALPASLTGAGVTAPGAGGSLLVATIDGSNDIFFTLKIGVDGQYVFDLITPNPTTVTTLDFSTVPPGNYPTGIYYDANTATWTQANPGNAEVFIHGNGSINPSGQGIGVGNNQFQPDESITFEFDADVSSVSISTVRASGSDAWDLAVEWFAYDGGALVGQGTTVFTGANGTFDFATHAGVLFDTLVLNGLTEAQNSLTTDDRAKFTLAELEYSQTFLPSETELAFNIDVYDGDGDMDSEPLLVTIAPPLFIVGKNISDVDPSTTTYQVGGGSGTIDGGRVGDILVGDIGGSNLQAVDKDYNIVLILDVSGSMATNDRIGLMKQAVNNLLGDFNDYQGGDVKVHVVAFSSQTDAVGTFTVTDDAGFNSAVSFVNGLAINGRTNYEAPLQSALNWLNGATSNDPIAGASTFTYFLSDGEPNRYMNGTTATDGSADQVMAQITGAGGSLGDNTNEVSQLQAFGEVVGVGISIGSTTLARLSVIDSGTDSALNVDDPADLSNALQSASPLNQLAGVGGDTLNGGDGSDLLFGDALYTDALAALHGISAIPGTGWNVFAQLELGQSAVDPTWDRSDTLAYIQNNAVALSTESTGSGGVTRTGGNDTLSGGAGNDTIFGQEGNDLIAGGAGNDALYGGSGADTFLFEATAPANGADTVHGFSVAQGDRLDLSQMLAAYDPSQDAIDDFVYATASGGNTVISVDVNGTGNAANAVAVATLTGVTGVDVDDLVGSGSLVT